jgi:hypothetical protein
MPEAPPNSVAKPDRKLSLDTWAVILAFLAAALIRFGLLPHVPW